jgi:IS5 family transposase
LTKNADQARDPEMHQTKTGNQWHFGMKLHIGADMQSGFIHSAVSTAANARDSQRLPELLHGEETRLYGDMAYAGQKETLKKNRAVGEEQSQERGACGHLAPVLLPQARLGLRQDPLPWHCQEPQSARHDVCTVQSAKGQLDADGISPSAAI